MTSVAFSPQGNRLLTTSDGLDVYDTEDWASALSLHDTKNVFTSATFDSTGAHMAVCGSGSSNRVRTFSMRDHLPVAARYTLSTLIYQNKNNKPLVEALKVLDEPSVFFFLDSFKSHK